VLARAIGISRKHMSNIVNGRSVERLVDFASRQGAMPS
jgi:hypothetical protein